MRIREQTAGRLVLVHQPLLPVGLGVLFIVVGFVPLAFPYRTTLHCEPETGCTVLEESVFGGRSRAFAWEEIEGLEVIPAAEGSDTEARIVLNARTSRGPTIPVDDAAAVQVLEDRMNALRDGGEGAIDEVHDRLLLLIFGMLTFVGGGLLLVVVFGREHRVVLDRAADLVVRTSTFASWQTHKTLARRDEVVDVAIDGGPEGTTGVVLVLKDERRVMVFPAFSNYGGEEKELIAAALRQFFGA